MVTQIDPEDLAQRIAGFLKMNGKHRREAPLFKHFAPVWLKKHVEANRHKASSRVGYESILRIHLLPRFAEKRLDEISADDVAELKAALADREPKTVNNILTVLSSILRKAVEWGELDGPPLRIELLPVDAVPEMDFYDFEEYGRLTAAAAQLGAMEEAAVRVMGDGGLRTGEVIALRWNAVNLERAYLVVSEAAWVRNGVEHIATPKGGITRRVPMTPELVRALARIPRGGPSERVFLRRNRQTGKMEPVSEQTLRTWFQKAQVRAGLRSLGKHGLRHTFCSHLAMLGESARRIQELAGHESITTTERYMHLAPNEASRAIERLSLGRAHALGQHEAGLDAPRDQEASVTGLRTVTEDFQEVTMCVPDGIRTLGLAVS